MISLFEEIGKQNDRKVFPYILGFYESYAREGMTEKTKDFGYHVLAYCDDERGSGPYFICEAEMSIWCLMDADIGPIKKKISREEAEVILRKLKEYKRKLENES